MRKRDGTPVIDVLRALVDGIKKKNQCSRVLPLLLQARV